jgi:hypothetical protein
MRPDLPHLKFAPSHRERILNGVKRATLRYDPDELPGIGEPFVLEEADTGDYLGTAVCIERGYERIDWLVKDPILGHRRYESEAELIRELEGYYPDAEFTPETCLEIVYWGKLIGRKIEFDLR